MFYISEIEYHNKQRKKGNNSIAFSFANFWNLENWHA